MTGRLPSFVVVGCLRAGTTSLWHLLNSHPSVATPAQKELHFFDRQFDLGLDRYRSHFDGLPDEATIGELTPNYVNEPEALERLSATLPDARLVMCVRDPVERLYSHYWMSRARGRETREFAEVARSELDSGAGTYLDASRYGVLYDRVLGVTERERFHLVVLESLVKDPRLESDRLFSHIGVDAHPDPQVLQANQYVSFRSSRFRTVLRRLEGRVPRPALAVGRRLNAVKEQYPPMPVAIAERYRSMLRPDMERFEAQTGIATACWR